MSHHSKFKPKQTSSTTPGSSASDFDDLARRGVNLGLIRDDVITESDRSGVLSLGPMLTVREVVSLLQVSRATVYSWVNQQKIPHLRINGVLRFSSQRLAAWLMELECGPRPVIVQPGQGDHDEVLQRPAPASVEPPVERKARGRASRGCTTAKSGDGNGSGSRSKTKWLIDLDALRQR